MGPGWADRVCHSFPANDWVNNFRIRGHVYIFGSGVINRGCQTMEAPSKRWEFISLFKSAGQRAAHLLAEQYWYLLKVELQKSSPDPLKNKNKMNNTTVTSRTSPFSRQTFRFLFIFLHTRDAVHNVARDLFAVLPLQSLIKGLILDSFINYCIFMFSFAISASFFTTVIMKHKETAPPSSALGIFSDLTPQHLASVLHLFGSQMQVLGV